MSFKILPQSIALIAFLTALFIPLIVIVSDPARAQAVREIQISAKKFEFTPNEIQAVSGVPLVLKLTSTDQPHGFAIPELNVRADIKPGQTTEVKITPQAPGVLHFYCDVFCGTGHDDMGGKIIVTKP